MRRRVDPLGGLLSGLGVPPPPPELRHETLAAASAALDGSSARDAWLAVWENTGLRWAWGAAVVALIAANFAVHARGGAGRVTSQTESVPLAASTDDELQRVVALPRLEARFLQPEPLAPSAPPSSQTRRGSTPSEGRS